MEREEKKCSDIPFDVVEVLLWARRRFARMAQSLSDDVYDQELYRDGLAIDCSIFAEDISFLLNSYGYHFMYEDLWDAEEGRFRALDQIHEEALRLHQRRRDRGKPHR